MPVSVQISQGKQTPVGQCGTRNSRIEKMVPLCGAGGALSLRK